MREILISTILHPPLLFGEIQRSSQVAGRISGTIVGETPSTSTKYHHINFRLLEFTLFAICLSVSFPPLPKHFHKNTKIFFIFLFLVWLLASLSWCLERIIMIFLTIKDWSKSRKILRTSCLRNLSTTNYFAEGLKEHSTLLDAIAKQLDDVNEQVANLQS